MRYIYIKNICTHTLKKYKRYKTFEEKFFFYKDYFSIFSLFVDSHFKVYLSYTSYVIQTKGSQELGKPDVWITKKIILQNMKWTNNSHREYSLEAKYNVYSDYSIKKYLKR